ncbi:MAG: thiol peroxidase [candidate division Zixibacteria bacterium]|nr:thiol peroxidase [candidate division Zixibacteria bacterium]
MKERSGIITAKGGPLTLLGNEIKVGDLAPEFELADNDLKPFKSSALNGKICIISTVPSLDTPTCDIETRRFNKEAEQLGDKVTVLTVSMDLPFAQKRWCGAAGVSNVKTLSDYRGATFGTSYGVLIKELHLLARVIFVLDRNGVIRYIQTVKDITTEPNYNEVLEAVKKLL